MPKVWGVPWIPVASIGTNCFLMGSIDKESFIRFSVFTTMIVVYYALVGLHASYDATVDSSTASLEARDLKAGVAVPETNSSSTKCNLNHVDIATLAP
jgi:APA family basic amino acid/polyamine antiporter